MAEREIGCTEITGWALQPIITIVRIKINAYEQNVPYHYHTEVIEIRAALDKQREPL